MQRALPILLAAAVLTACIDGDDQVATHAAALGVAPVNQLPGAQTSTEDSTLFFSVAGGNALAVSDADNTFLSVQIITTNGTFSLASASGLAVSGNGTSDLIASGPVVSLNAALDGAFFAPLADYSGPATLQLNTSDSNGESDLDVLSITVTAFNDSPVNIVPAGSQAATEDVPRAFTLSVTDPDVAGAPVLVSLTASNATLITLPTTTGLSFGSGDGSADAAMSFSGTLPDVNAALNGLVVTPPLNYIGASTLAITSNDQGASGAGAAGSDNDTIVLAWAAVNDAPVNTVPAAQAIDEDSSVTFSPGVADVDASTALVQVTLVAGGGTVTLGDGSALTFTSGDGTADVSMTFQGTLAALNAAMTGTVYAAAANFAGAGSVTMISNDLGNSGSGGVKQDLDVIAIQIAALNDAPVNSVPAPQLTNEDAPRVFSIASGNRVTTADPDAPSLQVTLTATGGTITLAVRTGLSFQAGDGIADPVTTFAGTVAAINAALDGASFVPGANLNGAASLRIVTSDLGATGAGGVLVDDDLIAITVVPVNDPPTAVNDGLAVTEDAAATSVAVLANDTFAPDVGESLTVTAVGTPLHGTASTDGVTVTYQPEADYHGADSVAYTVADGAGGTASATLAIAVGSVNDAPGAVDDGFAVVADSSGTSLAVLSNDTIAPDVGETLTISAVGAPVHGTALITSGATRISYTPDAGYSGGDAFTYTIGDGNGGVDTAAVTVDIATVITQPVNSLPGPQTAVEDSPLFFSSLDGNALSVSDANNATLTVQVLVSSGTFTLGSTANLTVSGNGTGGVTASGTIAALNAGLDRAKYMPFANFFGPAALTVNTSDSNGESDLDVLTLAITSFNDPPVNSVPTTVQAATEDLPRTFGTISISDVDLGGAEIVVSLTANNGTVISLPTTSGLSFATGDGSADAAMTFTAALSSASVALNGLAVTAPANYIGVSTLVITSNDQGASGDGGAGSDGDTVTLSWAAVNDPPINSVPPSQAIAEDGTVTFGEATGNALSVSDVDATTAVVQVTLVASGGTVTLGNPAGVTFTGGDGTGDTSMTFHGTLAALDSALAGTVYAATANFAGTGSLTMTSSDLGNSGGGGVKQDTDVVSIVVGAANDAPVNGVPGPQVTSEDIARVFSVSSGNPITAADADATSLQITLTATSGTVTLANRTGLTFQAGDGTADALMTFAGTVVSINTALNGGSFLPAANFNGAASLRVVASDLGATGAGGALVDDDLIAIAVMPINDPPVAANDVLTVAEDAASTAVAVLGNDTFAPDLGETLTVSAVGTPVHGTATTDGATVSYRPTADYNGPDTVAYTLSDGAGGTTTATIAITVTSVNDAPGASDDSFSVVADSSGTSLAVLTNDTIAPDVGETLAITAVGAPLHGITVITSGATRVSYTPAAGYSGPDSFGYTIGDGQSGTSTAMVTLDVVTVITRPVSSLPGPQTTVEDSPLFFSSVAANALTVSDANNATLTVQVLVTSGTFTLGSTSNLSHSGNGTAGVTASGTIAALNAGLNGARYTPTTNFHGAAALTLNASDSSGESDLDVLTLAVTSFNDPPVNNVPTTVQAATEDLPRTFGTISVTDVDLSGAEVQVSLTANNGTVISLPATSGLVFAVGDGVADPTMTFAGALASVNVVLNGVTVTAPANYIGPSTLVVATSDQGSTGAGPAGQDTDTVNLNWVAVNDPPVNEVPGAQSIVEEGTLTFGSATGTSLRVTDADVAAATMQVTLSATGGTLTLGNPAAVTLTVGDGLADTTMTFRGTVADVEAALDGTRYVANLNVTGATLVTMLSNDLGNTGGAARTDTDTVAIAIAGINDAPVITVPAALATNEDVARIFSTSQGNPVTVVDVDAAALQMSLTASMGTLTLATQSGLTFQAGDGTADATMTFTGTPSAINASMNGLRFTPAAHYSGIASFSLQVGDHGGTGAGGSLTGDGYVEITVVATNDPPDAVADTATTTEDTMVDVAVLGNDTTLPDVGETATVTAVGAPARGTAAIVGSSVRYTPAADYFGTDSFTYTIADGNGGLDSATVTITLTPVNDPPNAVDDAFTVAESSTGMTLAVRSNDTAAPDTGETLTITSVTTPAHGTATITGSGANTTIRYVPTGDYNGPDTFRYLLSDGFLADTATVDITVTSIDTQPVANNDTVVLVEDGAAAVAVLGNDTGAGDAPITVTVTVEPLHGTTLVQDDRTILYAPAANYRGPDSFTYELRDVDGDVDTATVAVTVTSVDDLPGAVADVLEVVEDESATVGVLDNDTGLGDGSVVVAIVTSATHGTVTAAAGGVLTYTPAANYAGADVFTYRATDADGDVSTATVTVTVTPVNDAPTATGDVGSTRIDAAVTISVVANDDDVDGDPLTVSALTVPVHGTAVIDAAGDVLYTPAPGYSGMDAFAYTISDGNGETATASVDVAVGLDGDGDGLLDLDEVEIHHTDPDVADTDGDELDDGVEVLTAGTDPLDDDSDDDGLLDGREDETSPLDDDSDLDGLGDGLERGLAAPEGQDTADGFVADADPETTTDPTANDTDGGGLDDGDEDLDGNGRVDGDETDPNDPADDVPDDDDDDDPPAEAGGCSAGGGSGGLALAAGLLGLLGLLTRGRARRPAPRRARSSAPSRAGR